MEFTIINDENQPIVRITLTMTHLDFLKAKLKTLDGVLLEECVPSKKISEKLMTLYIIARKIEDAQLADRILKG